MRLPDPLTPEALERIRRYLRLLGPGQPSGLDREAAVRLIEELQRHRGANHRYAELLHALGDR